MKEDETKVEEKKKDEEVEPIKEWEKAKPKTKSKKKIAIIIIVILLIIAVAGTGAFFYYQHKEETRSLGTTWGDTYYAYLKEAKEQKDFGEMEKYGLEPNMENTQLQFCQVEENEEPMMIMSYNKENKSYINAYHIGDDGKVINVAYKEPSKLELLYNISLKQYIWYIHVEKNNEDLYKPLTTAKEEIEENKDTNTISENTTNNGNDDEKGDKEKNTTTKEDIKEEELTAEITIEKDETTSVETVDGDVLSIPRFDETFVKPEIEESQKIGIDFNQVDESELKDLMETTVQGYKPNEQIITEEVKEAVNTKIEEVEQKQEEMKEAEEELKEKELEEEMKVTNENIQSKLGEHLKWFGAAYLGSTYGWGTVYEYKEVNVKIPGEHPDAMVYELVGAKSKANMESKLAQYVSRSKISKFKERADFMGDLKEYKGKVYWTNLGIGGGPYMKTNQAKVISSEDGITKVKLEEYSSLGEVLSAVITITFKYDEDTSKYLITDWSTKDMY